MIFKLTGILTAKTALQLIVDVSGVGYGVLAPMTTILNLPEIGQQVSLHTHLVVREDAQILYGFLEEKEKILFCELIKISGLGGKLALTILSHLTVEQFFKVIQLKDLSKLTNIPGVGQKIAQRLMVEMQNNLRNKKFQERLFFNLAEQNVKISEDLIDETITNDVQEALIALGYKSKEAMLAINSVVNNNKANNPINNSEELLKATLKSLSKIYYD